MHKESAKCSNVEKSKCVGDCQWSPFTVYKRAMDYELNAIISFGTMDKYNLCQTRLANMTSQASYWKWMVSVPMLELFGNCSLGLSLLAQLRYKDTCNNFNNVDPISKYYIGFHDPASIAIDPITGWPFAVNTSALNGTLLQKCLMVNCAIDSKPPGTPVGYFGPFSYTGCGKDHRVFADLRYPDDQDPDLVDAWAVCGSNYLQWNQSLCSAAGL